MKNPMMMILLTLLITGAAYAVGTMTAAASTAPIRVASN